MASSATKLSLENIKALFNLMDDERLATYKYVKQLQNNFKNELTELRVFKDNFQNLIALLYELIKDFMEKIEKSSHKQQAIINTPNKVLEIPDFQLTEMKIFEEPKYQSLAVPPSSLNKALNTEFNFKEFKETEPKQESGCFANRQQQMKKFLEKKSNLLQKIKASMQRTKSF
uniref:Uncharacterized protein n=1 Tax=Rhizophagus irregularis (strain DAOM 181602 / DAOM 197198 / MUCL 43194) TaxID=747089 RepID=U9UFQ1_RHIID